MKLTIDSTEPLAEVLRVLNSIYDVTLTAATDRSTAGNASGSAAPTRSTAARRRGKKATAGDRVDSKLVRQWAWENGHELSARGSLPAAVREAYKAANPS